MGDRALRARTAPVNYSQSTPEKWQTPLKERAKSRLKRKQTHTEAGGDKENTVFSFQVPVAQQEAQPQKKRGRPPKKQVVTDSKGELVGKIDTELQNEEPTAEAIASAQQEAQPVQPQKKRGRPPKKQVVIDHEAELVDRVETELQVDEPAAAIAGKKAEKVSKAKKAKLEPKTFNSEEDASETMVQEKPKQGRKPKPPGLDKEKLSKAVAAAVEAKSAKATRSGDEKERVEGNASTRATRSGDTEGEKESEAGGGGRNLKGKGSQPGGVRKRQAQKQVVVEIEGGEDAAPQKRAAGPSKELVPFIDASKAAAERQRELERGGADSASVRQMASFLKLQEAYEKLKTKYDEAKKASLRETESLFEEQKKVVKIHGEAATKLVNHWKSVVERLQQEQATAHETAKQTRELTIENAKLQIKLIDQEEGRILLETRLQEMQAELQAAKQQTLPIERPPPETRSVDVQVPSPTAKADWFLDAAVQVQTGELAVQNLRSSGTQVLDNLPTHQPASVAVQPSSGFFEIRKEDHYPQGFEVPKAACTEGDKLQGLGEGLEDADLDVGDPEEDNAWRELLMVLTGLNTVKVADSKIRFTHEESDFSFFLTATPKDEDDVTADVGRELDTLSRASSFFGDRAEDCIFSYEPEAFGLLEDDLSKEHELRRPQLVMTQQQVPRLINTIMAQTLRYSRAK